MKELEEFIDHISSCSECKEELEVYFALLTAMKQLDEDKNLSDNYSMELSDKLEKAEDKIIHQKLTFFKKCGALIMIIITVTIFSNIVYKKYDLIEDKAVVTNSTFKLRYNYFESRYRYNKMGEELEKYLEWEAKNTK